MSRGAADKVEISTYATGPRPVIALGIPSFGMVHLFFTARLINLRMPMNRIVRHFYIVGKEVGDARNEIVAKALAIEEQDPSLRCEWVYFIDDDLLIHPNALLRLLSHNKPIVSGLYYTKSSVATPLVLHGEYGGTAREWVPGELVECWAHGMGNTLIHADVFRRMRDEFSLGSDEYGHPKWFATTRDAGAVKADGTPVVLNQTEDVYFLRRAAELGYQPAVDTGPEAFSFHFDTKAMRGYPDPQWREFCEKGSISWPLSDGRVVTWSASDAA